MNYIIASNKNWYDFPILRNSKKLEGNFIYIQKKEDLTIELLKEVRPRYIFFPHWSYIIPKEIYENYEAIIFHMTDVPFGRGGSPLQNLISRKIYETKISALKCEQEIDAGPVYLKENLSLYGSAEEIYIRASKIIEKMIFQIIRYDLKPVKQDGDIIYFKRRTPSQSNVAMLKDLDQLYDYIRMMDAEGYPKAYLETEYFKFEFSRASLKKDSIFADVKITLRLD